MSSHATDTSNLPGKVPLTVASSLSRISEETKLLNEQKQKQFKEITPDNIASVIASLKVSLHEHYEESPTCIEIGECRFGTVGNFSAVIGKAKSRKTFLIALLLSAGVVPEKDSLNNVIKTTLPSGRQRSIFIDTEQSKADVFKVAKRISKLAESEELPNFDSYSLRSLKPADRRVVIEHIIYNTDDLGILVIDGIRDLVNDINSPEEATNISSMLLKWTEERQIHIVVVLHQNKADNNARGHLGTELVNKAETVISVEKDNEVSIVSPEYCRGKDFEQFAFGITEEGLPYILDGWQGKAPKGGRPKVLSPYDIPKETHETIIKKVFAVEKRMKYKDLVGYIISSLDENGVKVGETKARDYYSYYMKNDMIIKAREQGMKFDTYSLAKNLCCAKCVKPPYIYRR